MIARASILARRSVIGGLVAGAAMVPVGIVLRRTGHEVNVYGELLVDALIGATPPLALAVLHVAVSIALAIPFVAVATGRRRSRIGWGALYGFASWSVVNATALPMIFSRPTGWSLGLEAVWPSILIHVVYGAVLGTVTDPDRTAGGPGGAARRRVAEP